MIEHTASKKGYTLTSLKYAQDQLGLDYCEGLTLIFTSRVGYDAWYDEELQYLTDVSGTLKTFTHTTSPIITVKFAWDSSGYLHDIWFVQENGNELKMMTSTSTSLFTVSYELTGKLIGFKAGIESNRIVGI